MAKAKVSERTSERDLTPPDGSIDRSIVRHGEATQSPWSRGRSKEDRVHNHPGSRLWSASSYRIVEIITANVIQIGGRSVCRSRGLPSIEPPLMLETCVGYTFHDHGRPSERAWTRRMDGWFPAIPERFTASRAVSTRTMRGVRSSSCRSR